MGKGRPLLAGIAALLVGVGSAAADLRVVAPSAPGSGWDGLAQSLKMALSDERDGEAVDVVNVPGGGGTAGLTRFLADGGPHDLLVTGATMVNTSLMNRAPVLLDRLTPVARLSQEAFAIAVAAGSPFRTVGELAAAMANDAAKITWAGGPLGGIDHVAAILFAEAVGVAGGRLSYVPFLTSADAAAALAEGQLAAAFLPVGELAGEMKTGRVRALAVSSAERVDLVDAPTLASEGIPLEVSNWRGLVAKPGLDALTRAKLLARALRLLGSRTWKETLERRGWQSAYLPPEEFGVFLAMEQARTKRALKAAGVLKGSPD